MTTQYTGQTFSLAQDILAGTTYATLDFTFEETPVFTAGIIKVDVGQQSEWFVITGLALVSGTTYRATVTSRGLKKDATSTTDVDSTLQKDHSSTATCTFVTHSLDWNEKIDPAGNTTWTGDNTFTDSFSVSNTTSAAIIHQTVTTTQRDALTGVGAGDLLYNSTTTTEQVRKNASWADIPTGATNSNATETASGKVELATVAEQLAATSENILQTQYLIRTATGALSAQSGKVITTDSSGLIPYLFYPLSGSRWGGNGSDGDLSGNVTISGSNNTYIIKNYNNITAGAFTLNVTPTGCIVHIKVRGNCDLTGWTIDVANKGMTGGSGGTTSAASAPQDGTSGGTQVLTSFSFLSVDTNNTGGGGASVAGAAAGTASVVYGLDPDFMQAARIIALAPGEGGTGGGGGYNKTTAGGGTLTAGAGGTGGGCIFFEVAGNLTFSSTTIDVRGGNGAVGYNGAGDGTNGHHAGGGGGGGAGGVALFLYNGTLTGSPTSLVTGGTGGAGGDDTARPNTGYGGGGGAGGSNIYTSGNNGTAGSTTTAGAGGNGAAGEVIIQQNAVFM